MTGRSIALFAAAALAETGGATWCGRGLRDDRGALLVVLDEEMTVGTAWTTDAQYRETETAIASARDVG